VNEDDFAQYWLGIDTPSSATGATGFAGGGVLSGTSATIGDTASPVGMFSVTSDILPQDRFPQFASAGAGRYENVRGPFEPFDGAGQAAITHRDNAYARLTRVIDLSDSTAAQSPTLAMALSYDTEPGWDPLVVEARTAGGEDWTTLPFTGSGTTVPESCALLAGIHPHLTHYVTPAASTCSVGGSTGTWYATSGSSNGWQQVTVDLSAYAGKAVELSTTYISDGSTGGRGAFVDDTRVLVGGVAVAEDTFEQDLGGWTSVDGGWHQSDAVSRSYAAVSTERTVTLGFELGDLTSASAILRKALGALR
jgi:hypothetical protein